ncbi:hypothetical protein PINS_up024425 [Pythium insidiosum]|nr:hypothetical protein PINS_up024425 [Pythium insidiosum]
MDSGGIYVVSILVAVAVALPVIFFCQHRYLRERQQWQELHAPLSDDENERRLDAAIRDAQKAPRTCSACGFENLHRFIFCGLCGAAIDATRPATMEVTMSSLTLRQRRARLRKQWTRRVDVEGNAFWYCDTADDPANVTTAVVLSFEQIADSTAQTEAELARHPDVTSKSPDAAYVPSSPSSSDSSLSSAPTSLTLIALDVRTNELNAEIRRHRQRLLPSADADPLCCALLVRVSAATKRL